MSWQDTKVSMVANANGNTTRHEAIGQILANIRSGKWARQVERIRDIYSEVLAMEGLEAAKEAITPYKKQLPGFLASGVFEKRVKNAKPKIPSGLLCVDLDGLGDRVAAVRATLADDPYAAAFWGSPSGAGLKVIVRIQPDLNLFYRSFCAAREHFRDLGLVVDEQCKDPIRLCFVGHDPNLVMRNGDVLILEPLPESEAELSQPASAVSGRDDEPISTHLETRIKMYLDKVCPAIQGDHGNKPSFRTACVLTWSFALSFEDAKPLMRYYSEKY
jgi:BT4734-like, N-terminal domain